MIWYLLSKPKLDLVQQEWGLIAEAVTSYCTTENSNAIIWINEDFLAWFFFKEEAKKLETNSRNMIHLSMQFLLVLQLQHFWINQRPLKQLLVIIRTRNYSSSDQKRRIISQDAPRIHNVAGIKSLKSNPLGHSNLFCHFWL